ncbi:MAG TPA: hypothetical protein VFB78_05735 [Acidimicrobiales bacterium]|nr:hypothetical protein [Acidimicrobiales bacterium]
MANEDELMESVANVLDGELAERGLLREQTEGLMDVVAQLGKVSASYLGSVVALRQTRSRRHRWRTLIAVAASAAGLMTVLWSSRLDQGYGQTLLETLGAALITYVFIDLLVRWTIELPDDTFHYMEKQSRIWEDALAGAVSVAHDLHANLKSTRSGEERLRAIVADMRQRRPNPV